MSEECIICGKAIAESVRLVMVRDNAREAHCSASCLKETVRKATRERIKTRRFLLIALLVALLPAAGNIVSQRFRMAKPVTIMASPPPALPEAVPAGPVQFGPVWPPTDEDWIGLFSQSGWTYPLPGPLRRATIPDMRIFGPDPPAGHAAVCREEGHCGVDLGGEIWGEHVYAAHDGIVDHVQGNGNDDRGGEYVRLAHFGGMVFTQYFHLAAIPRTIFRGARVKAGDVIGLLGDTGIRGPRRHLYFALSVRPSIVFSEMYWDPKPWMAVWQVRLPPNGTVAGYAPPEKDKDMIPRRHRSR